MSCSTRERAPVREAASSRGGTSEATRRLQRRCACGGTSGGTCETCRKPPLQRRTLSADPAPDVPVLVDEVIGGAGMPLEPATRSFFERGFGHDFSAVRIHDDERAARSAREVDAVAYTVGRHVAFDSGRYAPQTPGGRHLLAHELAHVVQQDGARPGAPPVQCASVSPEARLRVGPAGDESEREADRAADAVARGGRASPALAGRAALQRAVSGGAPHPAIVGLDEAGPGANLAGRTDEELAACMKDAKADPAECSPSRSLTWADFAAAPKAASGFSAETFAPVADKPMDPAKAACLERILGKSKDETRVFQALFDSSKSWVMPRFKNPTNTQITGCGKDVKPCTDFFKANPAGGTWTTEGTPSAECPASAVAAKVVSNSAADCSAIEAECTRTAEAESARLLAHEQGHFDISCVLAKKANLSLAAGGKLADIRTAVAKTNTEKQKAYDDDTTHGCDASAQATWVTDIANGLPKVSIP